MATFLRASTRFPTTNCARQRRRRRPQAIANREDDRCRGSTILVVVYIFSSFCATFSLRVAPIRANASASARALHAALKRSVSATTSADGGGGVCAIATIVDDAENAKNDDAENAKNDDDDHEQIATDEKCTQHSIVYALGEYRQAESADDAIVFSRKQM